MLRYIFQTICDILKANGREEMIDSTLQSGAAHKVTAQDVLFRLPFPPGQTYLSLCLCWKESIYSFQGPDRRNNARDTREIRHGIIYPYRVSCGRADSGMIGVNRKGWREELFSFKAASLPFQASGP
ncbi:MAG: hypothetical protein ACXVBR_15715 [Flavisolibacter sp.]